MLNYDTLQSCPLDVKNVIKLSPDTEILYLVS